MIRNPPSPLKNLAILLAIGFALSATLLIYLVSSAATATGSSPELAIAIASGKNTGVLGPGEKRWFRVIPRQDGSRFQDLRYSMFYTDNDGVPPHNVNFELYTGEEISTWQRGGKSAPANFGAGMSVSRDGAAATGERIWRGTVLRDGTYYLSLENSSDAVIDYWLFDDDVTAVALNTPSDAATVATPPALAPSPGLSPQTALPFTTERQVGRLAPGQEVWYSFSVDNTPEQFEETALTLVITPDDGQRVWNVDMGIYTAAAVQTWSPGNSASLDNVGVGSVVHRDSNPLTGERFWSGWVVNNNLYYVRLANGTAVPIDYWLFPGDVYQPSLGS